MNKKLSIYNSYIKVSDRFSLIFNATTDRFVVAQPEIVQRLRDLSTLSSAIKTEDIEQRWPGLYAQLSEIGAIVNDDLDEVQDLQRTISEIDNDESVFWLHINPTLDCNFKCWYCYESHVPGSRMDAETIEAVNRLITAKCREGKMKCLVLAFFGGEPLMAFDRAVKPILQHAAHTCGECGVRLSVGFTTNSFLLTDAMMESMKGIDASFQITLDGGREQHNKTRFARSGKGSYDTILTNIGKLAAAGFQTYVRINYTRENLPGIPSLIEDMAHLITTEQKKFISIDLQRVWQEECDGDEQKDMLRELITRFRAEGFHVSTVMGLNRVYESCYGDKRNYIMVNYNGDLYLCTARDFKPSSRAGYLHPEGYPVWENDALERRMNCKFVKPVCHRCRIAPICGGGCRQHALEHQRDDGCQYGWNEDDLDRQVLDRLEYHYMPD